jgi:hypothetical protein
LRAQQLGDPADLKIQKFEPRSFGETVRLSVAIGTLRGFLADPAGCDSLHRHERRQFFQNDRSQMSRAQGVSILHRHFVFRDQIGDFLKSGPGGALSVVAGERPLVMGQKIVGDSCDFG